MRNVINCPNQRDGMQLGIQHIVGALRRDLEMLQGLFRHVIGPEARQHLVAPSVYRQFIGIGGKRADVHLSAFRNRHQDKVARRLGKKARAAKERGRILTVDARVAHNHAQAGAGRTDHQDHDDHKKVQSADQHDDRHHHLARGNT